MKKEDFINRQVIKPCGGDCAGCEVNDNCVFRKSAADFYDEHIAPIVTEKEVAELVAFAVVRNSVVAPVGYAKGKTEKEISQMTVDTLAEIRKMLNFDAMRAFRALAESK